jgi:hypothetical protein
MIGTDFISTIIRATFLSARVKAEQTKVVSLFLVAPFERGKTSLVLKNQSGEPVVVSDVSGMGILEALLQNQKATHVVINDLSAVTGHKETVSRLTIAILNGLAEEGIYKIAIPRMQHLDLSGRRVGVIACCVPSLVNDQRSWWIRSGFLSRMLVLKFDHSIKLQNAIMESIKAGRIMRETMKSFKIPEYPVKVNYPDKYSRRIMQFAKSLARHTEEVGYRKQKQLRGLAGGHALLRPCNWKRGTSIDHREVDFIHDALPFLENGQDI